MSAELRGLVKVIHAISPGAATHAFEVHTHAGDDVRLLVGAEGEPTRILLPESLTSHQITEAAEEIRRILDQGGCSPSEFFRRVAGAAGIFRRPYHDDFTMVIR